MTTKEKKVLFLSNLFIHLDGIVLIPTILELEKKQILSNFTDSNLTTLSIKHNANKGYLNVALRLLCSQGLLKQTITNDEVYYTKTPKSSDFIRINKTYNLLQKLYDTKIDYSVIINNNKSIHQPILINTITDYLKKYSQKQELNTYERHLEGAVLGPILVELGQNGCFERLEEKKKILLEKVHPNYKKLIIDLLICTQIIDTNHIPTGFGFFILKRVTSYGVTVSYLPTYKNIKNLLFGNYKILWNEPGTIEKHVDRSMNVWGSGGAHNTYFKKIDKIIIDLFNLPIKDQPKGFIDIGCGNGKLIEHIFDLIYYKTKRGKVLEEFPLFIVGSDFNYKALDATNETIKKADIWAKTAFGDISNPDSLARRLKKEYKINLEDLLNIRSFLDHNRIFTIPKETIIQKSFSTGAFVAKGEKIDNSTLQQNLKEHFEKWYPYLIKYGLLIVELHTIDPTIAANSIGKTAITAYDASHGFSDQYIIEYNLFLETALKVGLKPDPIHEYTFPSREIPIVSINRLIKS